MIRGLVVRLDPDLSAERVREIIDAIVAIDGTGPIYPWNPIYQGADTQDVRPAASAARTGE